MTFDLSRRKVRAGSRVHARPLVVKFGETGLVQDVRVEVSEYEWWPYRAQLNGDLVVERTPSLRDNMLIMVEWNFNNLCVISMARGNNLWLMISPTSWRERTSTGVFLR